MDSERDGGRRRGKWTREGKGIEGIWGCDRDHDEEIRERRWAVHGPAATGDASEATGAKFSRSSGHKCFPLLNLPFVGVMFTRDRFGKNKKGETEVKKKVKMAISSIVCRHFLF